MILLGGPHFHELVEPVRENITGIERSNSYFVMEDGKVTEFAFGQIKPPLRRSKYRRPPTPP